MSLHYARLKPIEEIPIDLICCNLFKQNYEFHKNSIFIIDTNKVSLHASSECPVCFKKLPPTLAYLLPSTKCINNEVAHHVEVYFIDIDEAPISIDDLHSGL